MKRQKEKGQKATGTKKNEESSEATKEQPAAHEQREHSNEKPVPDATPQPGNGRAGTESSIDEAQANDATNIGSVTAAAKPAHNRQPSLSLQSRMRSSSFRRNSVSQGPMSPSTNGAKSPTLGITSPDGDTITDIYRKQAARLDELERENRRLAKEASDAEGRWKSMEAEIEELREASPEVAELRYRAQQADAKDEEISKLVCESV